MKGKKNIFFSKLTKNKTHPNQKSTQIHQRMNKIIKNKKHPIQQTT